MVKKIPKNKIAWDAGTNRKKSTWTCAKHRTFSSCQQTSKDGVAQDLELNETGI
jgi:hypothetical protein